MDLSNEAGEGGDAMDISNSPAYVALDALLAEEKLTQQAVVDMYRAKYAQLHDYVIQTYDREKSMLQRAKVLNQSFWESEFNSKSNPYIGTKRRRQFPTWRRKRNMR